MQQIQGIVEFFNERPTNFGMMYGIKVNGIQFGTGKTKPACAKGDNVSFSAVQNAKGYWDIKGPITHLVGSTATDAPTYPMAPQTSSPLPTATEYKSKEDTKQRVISRQAARNAAIAFLTIAQTAGVLPTPKAKGSGFDMLREMLNQLTSEFYEDSLDPDNSAGTSDETEAPLEE